MLSNLKILMIAVLMRSVLKRSFNIYQVGWGAAGGGATPAKWLARSGGDNICWVGRRGARWHRAGALSLHTGGRRQPLGNQEAAEARP